MWPGLKVLAFVYRGTSPIRKRHPTRTPQDPRHITFVEGSQKPKPQEFEVLSGFWGQPGPGVLSRTTRCIKKKAEA